MADCFLSDVHLRLDRPDRGERLARLIDGLGPTDSLTVVGDLCDFWFTSRQADREDPMRCPGLRSLAGFRDRGGELTILLGNHDAWLGSFYERTLGARIAGEPLRRTCSGIAVHAAHGHRLGGRKPWKAMMESGAFLRSFSALPGPLATALADRLKRSNNAHLVRAHARHLAAYRSYARLLADRGEADLVLIGHVHGVYDEPAGTARLIVLGDWIAGASHVRIDDRGARFVVDRPEALDLRR